MGRGGLRQGDLWAALRADRPRPQLGQSAMTTKICWETPYETLGLSFPTEKSAVGLDVANSPL